MSQKQIDLQRVWEKLSDRTKMEIMLVNETLTREDLEAEVETLRTAVAKLEAAVTKGS